MRETRAWEAEHGQSTERGKESGFEPGNKWGYSSKVRVNINALGITASRREVRGRRSNVGPDRVTPHRDQVRRNGGDKVGTLKWGERRIGQH